MGCDILQNELRFLQNELQAGTTNKQINLINQCVINILKTS